eukprot:CAMPEP_0174831818 /NCGR_PEP_ID=MMETSP1114-20130205/3327_1 /TAXON_ID=312471 /ORGANISM="Neobodo designis, Strain CCAP 1951/1" /LENGTH=172 /DNA_ID=CAMNT_0016065663 /DNA_START=75 /DNA_END=593 /DNA_ORIENTATION=+
MRTGSRSLRVALVTVALAAAVVSAADSWLTASYTATRTGVDITPDNFAVDLARDVGGVDWRTFMEVRNVTLSPSLVRFTVAASPAKFDDVKGSIANLTATERTALGVRSITENVPKPPPRKTNPWIVGVVFGGLAVAGVAIGFAEYTARGARARRRARQNQPSMNAGMLTDN